MTDRVERAKYIGRIGALEKNWVQNEICDCSKIFPFSQLDNYSDYSDKKRTPQQKLDTYKKEYSWIYSENKLSNLKAIDSDEKLYNTRRKGIELHLISTRLINPDDIRGTHLKLSIDGLFGLIGYAFGRLKVYNRPFIPAILGSGVGVIFTKYMSIIADNYDDKRELKATIDDNTYPADLRRDLQKIVDERKFWHIFKKNYFDSKLAELQTQYFTELSSHDRILKDEIKDAEQELDQEVLEKIKCITSIPYRGFQHINKDYDFDNTKLNTRPNSKTQQVILFHEMDYLDQDKGYEKGYSVDSRLESDLKQSEINKAGFSAFKPNENGFANDEKAIEYLKGLVQQHGKLNILQWSTHGVWSPYEQAQKIANAGVLKDKGILVMDQCQNAGDVEGYDGCKRAARDFNLHIYASEKDENTGEGFTDGMLHFYPDGRVIREKPPLK